MCNYMGERFVVLFDPVHNAHMTYANNTFYSPKAHALIIDGPVTMNQLAVYF
jgi:nicotinic acid mononucleotide adenylyltransferase